MSDLVFEKWFSSLNAADFPMDFLARLNGEYCNPATRTMLDMYMANVDLEQQLADRDAEIVRLLDCLERISKCEPCTGTDHAYHVAGKMARTALQHPEQESE